MSDQLFVTCASDASAADAVRAAVLARGLGSALEGPSPASALPPREDRRRHHAQQQPYHDQLRQVLRRERRLFSGGTGFQK